MADATIGPIGWERALMAAEKVKERLRRATKALDVAAVPYAVIGDNAAAEWVGRVDEDAVRNTRDIDLLIRRDGFAAARAVLESVGFTYQQLQNVETFVDKHQGKLSRGVRIFFADERIRPNDEYASPGVCDSERAAEFQVIKFDALVKMELIAWRTENRVNLRDLADVGLVDATWPARLPPPLGDRLQQLLDDPNDF